MTKKLAWRYDGKTVSREFTLSDVLAAARGEFTNYNTNSVSMANVIDAMRDGKVYRGGWASDIGEDKRPLRDQVNDRLRGVYGALDKAIKSVEPMAHGNAHNSTPVTEWGMRSGYCVDRLGYARGEPFCYGRRTWEIDPSIGSAVIRIMIGYGGNSHMSSEEIMRTAISGIEVATALQEAGRNVEIYGVFCGVSSVEAGKRNWCSINYTNTPTKVALTCIGSTAMFRALGYPLLDLQNHVRFGETYGRAESWEDLMPGKPVRQQYEAAGCLTANDLFLPAGIPQRKAQQLVEEFIAVN